MFDPARPTLKSRIAAGDCIALAWLSLGSVAVAECALRAGVDAVVFDAQHGLWERRELEAAIGLLPSHVPAIVRVAENSAFAIGAALDAGAEGVMVPMVESADEAGRAVRFAKYPPHGVRSAGGVRPLSDFGAYVAAADALAVIVMIETAAGLRHAEAIARVAGLDMVFIGTGDLALSLQTDPASSSRHADACDEILQACGRASLPCGLFTGSPDAAVAHRDRGYGMVVAANDIGVVGEGFARASAALAAGKAAS